MGYNVFYVTYMYTLHIVCHMNPKYLYMIMCIFFSVYMDGMLLAFNM